MEIAIGQSLIFFGVALVISFFTSTGGVSGAFLLLPFQHFYLGTAAPSISATNHIFNIIATPGGIFRYFREGRMNWGLVLPLAAGSVPGAILGAWIRIQYLPDARDFKLFAGFVLFTVALRLILGGRVNQTSKRFTSSEEEKELSHVSRTKVGLFAGLVGVIGGIYGVGGGIFIAPFLITVFKLSVRITAGATLACTWITSFAGAFSFEAMSLLEASRSIAPDWNNGLFLGLGGLLGTYVGARCQKYLPEPLIKIILAAGLVVLSLIYIIGYFL